MSSHHSSATSASAVHGHIHHAHADAAATQSLSHSASASASASSSASSNYSHAHSEPFYVQDCPADSGVTEEENSNPSLISHLLSSVSKGHDLSKVLVPTIFLEPRALIEKYSDLFIHPQLFVDVAHQSDEITRFLAVLKWYLSAWHIRPKGCKKPYNPVLGEKFFCFFEHEDNDYTEYVAEQVSHHPPISAVHVENRKHGVVLNSWIHAKSKFFGNSAGSIMLGSADIYQMDRPDEVYSVGFPTIVACGLFLGTLRMELGGDPFFLRCPHSGLEAEIQFLMKPFFGGDYNRVRADVRRKGKSLYHLEGRWDSVINITDSQTKKTSVFLDIPKTEAYKKTVAKIENQGPFESRRIWAGLTSAVKSKDFDAASNEKTKVEEAARERAKQRAANNVEYQTELFSPTSDGGWKYKMFNLDPDQDIQLRERPAELANLIQSYQETKSRLAE